MRIRILLLAFISVVSNCFAEDFRLWIDIGGLRGYDIDSALTPFERSESNTLIVGSVVELIFFIRPFGQFQPTFTYEGEQHRLPEAFTLEIADWSADNSECQPDHLLRDNLKLQQRISPTRIWHDSLWKATGALPPQDLLYPEVRLSFVVPSDLAGRTICFGATWSDEQWGTLHSMPVSSGKHEQKPLLCPVKMPSSAADIQRAKESHLFDTFMYRAAATVLDQALTMIAEGDSSASVFFYTIGAATAEGRYDDAIQFLDRCYASYGVVPSSGDSATSSEGFRAERDRLLHKKSQPHR